MRSTHQYALQLGLPLDRPAASPRPASVPVQAPLTSTGISAYPYDPEAEAFDYMFSHVSFCHSAFPQGCPTDQFARITRRNGRFAVTIDPARIALPGEDRLEVRLGVPYGAKPRLLTVWAVTQLQDPTRRSDDNYLEVGPIRDFFTALGTSWSGQSLTRTKDQLLRLAFTRMTMVMEGTEADSVMETSLFDGSVLPPGTLRLYRDGDFKNIIWPQALKVNDTMAATFRKHSIPIPTQRLRMVADNPMATDIFLYWCYRLPFLEDDEHLTFKALAKRFGDGIPPSKFKAKFLGSLNAAKNAYPEANISIDDQNGMVLRRSDPAALRQAFIQVPSAAADQAEPKRRRRSSRRYNNVPVQRITAMPT